MGLFGGKKQLGSYKILDVVNVKKAGIDFDEALKGTTDPRCKVLYENGNVQYLQWTEKRMEYSSNYILCREKGNKEKVIYLGTSTDLVCYCNGNIFYVFPYAISMDNHCMTMIDCKSGEHKEISFLDGDKVLSLDTNLCGDKVIKIQSVCRRKETQICADHR